MLSVAPSTSLLQDDGDNSEWHRKNDRQKPIANLPVFFGAGSLRRIRRFHLRSHSINRINQVQLQKSISNITVSGKKNINKSPWWAEILLELSAKELCLLCHVWEGFFPTGGFFFFFFEFVCVCACAHFTIGHIQLLAANLDSANKYVEVVTAQLLKTWNQKKKRANRSNL